MLDYFFFNAECEMNEKKTSWQDVAGWYDSAVGYLGHYFHQNVILPKLLPLMDLKPNSSLLDVGCGQGILARSIPKQTTYVGLDAAADLIQAAKSYDKNSKHTYLVQDATQPFPLEGKEFSHAVVLLALQNMEDPKKVFENIRKFLKKDGKLFLVLNHPCFRIPRQTAWGIEEQNKLQYRRINRYMSPLKIPLAANPSQGTASKTTLSFHFPLSAYSKWLKEAGFCITLLDEWISDKESQGKNAKMENRSREEFPLFLTIVADAVN